MSDSNRTTESEEWNDHQLEDLDPGVIAGLDRRAEKVADKRIEELVDERLAELESLKRRVELLEDRLDVDPEEAELRETAEFVERKSALTYEGPDRTGGGRTYVQFRAGSSLRPSDIDMVREHFNDYAISTESDGEICLTAARPIRGGDEA